VCISIMLLNSFAALHTIPRATGYACNLDLQCNKLLLESDRQLLLSWPTTLATLMPRRVEPLGLESPQDRSTQNSVHHVAAQWND
jgi:hypothetical protein